MDSVGSEKRGGREDRKVGSGRWDMLRVGGGVT